MKHNYQKHQPEVKEITQLKFKHQIKCQGVCGGKTFTAKDGNRKYCDDCQKKMGKHKYDTNLKRQVSKQKTLIEEEKDRREKLLRGDYEI